MTNTDVESDASLEPAVLRALTEEQKGRLTEQLDLYLRSLEAGETIDADQFSSQNPDLRDAFAVYLNKLDALYGVAVGFQNHTNDAIAGVDPLADGPLALGDFTIVRELGRGGMGVVYEALQKSLDRKVALKLLPMASLLDIRQIARFKNEAHAAGSLQHPHIVPVHCVGSEQGLHFYAMQLIDGDPIDAWVRQQSVAASKAADGPHSVVEAADGPHSVVEAAAGPHSVVEAAAGPHGVVEAAAGPHSVVEAAAGPHGVVEAAAGPHSVVERTQQDWRRIVNWVTDIADALHRAHQTGVVHRDVKPSNLLLDRSGKIWITDFGLARCQNDLSLTISGDMLGTMRYMSPEQAAGKAEAIDHRTDIYSLGATLFEMLTLRPAIVGDNGPALLRAIEQHEPPRLRDFVAGVPKDLGIILQKAMAKRRDDRYESAEAFADDLRAVADGLPISAKPPSTAVWVGRWMLRHQRAVTAASIVLALALAWLVVSGVVIRQQMQDVKFAEQRADYHFRQGHATVRQLGSQVAEQLAAIPGTEHVRQSLLHQTLAYYEQFAAAAEGDPKLEAELAATQSQIGTLVKELQSGAAAIPHFRRAAKIFASLDDTSDAETRLLAAENLNHLALALADGGFSEEAIQHYQVALQIQRSLVASRPSDSRFATELAVTNNNLGLLMRELDQPQRASILLQDSVTQLAKLVAQDNHSELAARSLSAALANLASISLESQPERAIELLQRALQQRLSTIDKSSNRFRCTAEIATVYNNLGSAYLRDEQASQGETSFASAIRLLRQLHAIAPLVDQYSDDLAMSLNNLSIAQQRQNKHALAARSATEAIELQNTRLAGTADPVRRSRLGAMQHNLAESLVALQNYRDAETALRAAIENQEAALRATSPGPHARSQLMRHYGSLLRCQIRARQWSAVKITAAAYRRAAGSDASLLKQVEQDLSEAAKHFPTGWEHRRVHEFTVLRRVQP